jgi:hypothetical protein
MQVSAYSQIVQQLKIGLKRRFRSDTKSQDVCLQLLKEKPIAQIIKDSIKDQSRLYCLRIPMIVIEAGAINPDKPITLLHFDPRDPKPKPKAIR